MQKVLKIVRFGHLPFRGTLQSFYARVRACARASDMLAHLLAFGGVHGFDVHLCDFILIFNIEFGVDELSVLIVDAAPCH